MEDRTPKGWLVVAALLFSNTQAAPQDWLIGASIGYSHILHNPAQTFKISNYDTDRLTQVNQVDYPTYNISAKYNFPLAHAWLHAFNVGPAFYYSSNRFTGTVWEVQSPTFNNYKAALTSKAATLLAEGDLYFATPYIQPFLSAGLGFSILELNYADRATLNIQPQTALQVGKNNLRLTYTLGAGLSHEINCHWSILARYAYLHVGGVATGTDTSIRLQQAIYLDARSHNFLIGLTFRD
jgi:opacity protein-like surface antigen